VICTFGGSVNPERGGNPRHGPMTGETHERHATASAVSSVAKIISAARAGAIVLSFALTMVGCLIGALAGWGGQWLAGRAMPRGNRATMTRSDAEKTGRWLGDTVRMGRTPCGS
jgi:hypothetical protein